MKNLNKLAAWLTLLLGLLATWLIIVSGQYWALAIGVLVVLVDVAAVAPGLWAPALQRWWGQVRGVTPPAAQASVGPGAPPQGVRRTRRPTNMPARGDVCEVIEISPYNPSSKSVVRFHQGAGRTDHTIPHNPDDTMQILGQSGWSIFYSGTDASAGRRYWVLNRDNIPTRAIDDALPRLR